MFHITLATMLGTIPLVQPAPVDPNPASLTVPADDDAVARKLVAALGDEYFNAREEAARDLREMGRMALPAIRDGLENSTVPEVVRRCELLYPRAFALETRARVDCFVADTAGKYKHDLPGADEFFAITGRTDQARQLYRDMILSPNRDLLTALGQADEVVAAAAANRRIQLNPRANGPSSGALKQASALDVIAVLFVETTIPDQGGGVGVNAPTYLISTSQLRTALDTDPRKDALAAVTVKWFETRTDPRNVAACMNLATTLKLPVAVPMAKKMLDSPTATPQQKAQAACKVAQAGTADDIPLLAPLLQDEGVAYNGAVIVNGQRQNQVIQLRDVALAMSMLMAKKDPADAGMKSRYPNNPSDSLKFNYFNFHFEDDGKVDDTRDAAIAKWYEWAEANVKKYPKAPPPKAKADEGKKADPAKPGK
jgi:hypothetical protein